ncbi:MAG: nucleoside triphosphate pyrophosphohydrolase [Treponema sp.]
MSTLNSNLNAENSVPDFNSVLYGEFNSANDAFGRLYNVIKILRSENGCPWDREQTPLSMRQDLIEETFEAVDAITMEDAVHSKEELGDVILNATMISYMNEQSGNFSVADVLNELAEKLIRRHPHVFPASAGKVCADTDVKTSTEVLNQWDKIKEKVEGRKSSCILDEVPKGFPPLLKSFKMQKKAAKKGFDWDKIEDVKAKITEEFREAEEARITDDKKALESEIGDLLFAVVNYARHLGVNPDVALNIANKKFYRRFSYVQQKMEEAGEEMLPGKLELMDKFWNEAKTNEKK